MNKSIKRKYHQQLVEKRKQLGNCKSKAIHIAGEYKGKKNKGDNPRGMSRVERGKREPFYLGNGKYLPRDYLKKTANLKVLVCKGVNQIKGKPPFEHLNLSKF